MEQHPGDAEAFFFVVEVGKQLMELHRNYESAPEYPLQWIWNPDVERSFHITKMHFNADKSAIVVNSSLTLAGIPPQAHEYMLGNRSALEWIVDQYQITRDERSGIVSDPNRQDDPEYIARLVCKIVYVSIETVRLQRLLAERILWSNDAANAPPGLDLRDFWK